MVLLLCLFATFVVAGRLLHLVNMAWSISVLQVATSLSWHGLKLPGLQTPGAPQLDVELDTRLQAAYVPAVADALFSPVTTGDIETPEPVIIEAGQLPEDMPRGVLLRNGPNSEEVGGGFLDGDGMIHSVALGDGGCWYSRAYVATHGRRMEAARAKKYKGTLVHAPKAWPMLAALATNVKNGLMPPQKDTANTGIEIIGNDIYATMEQARPVRLSVDGRGSVSKMEAMAALGKNPTWDPLSGGTFAAHGRLCPDSGEYLAITYSITLPPYARLDVFDERGVPVETRPIDVHEPVMIHDLAITKNYAVVLDGSLALCIPDVLINKFPVAFDQTKRARIGLAPRKGGPTVWCDVDPYVVLHCANAYEDGRGSVVVQAMRCRTPRNDETYLTHYFPAHLYEWVLDIDTGTCVSERWLNPDIPVEFPVVDPAQIGSNKANRVFAIQLASYGGPVKWFQTPHHGCISNALVALSLNDGRVLDRYQLAQDSFLLCEPTFVPRDVGAQHREADDGYILAFATRLDSSQPATRQPIASSLLILDAKRLHAGPVATLRLPHVVPYGLHSKFVHATM